MASLGEDLNLSTPQTSSNYQVCTYVTHTRVFVGGNLHIMYQGARGLGLGRTFVRPFSVDFIQQKRDDWFMKYSCGNK